jgi:hypothetical protein
MPVNSGPKTKEAATRQDRLKFQNLGKNTSSDSEKYAAAVAMARNDLAGKNVDRTTFKNAIDSYYNTMGASKSGREMRGEDSWTDFVQGVNDFTHGVNTGIGNGIDWLWDNGVGKFTDLVAGKEAGDAVKNFMTGEDLSIIPDIASDVLLTIPGWTIPLVVAKEGFRNADNFNEAISGKDSVTLEDLDDSQRAAKAALGTMGVGLSVLPGVGKAKSIANIAKNSSAAAKKTAAGTSKALDAAEEAAKTDKLKYEKALEQYPKDLDEYQKLQNPEDLLKLSSPGSKMTPEGEAELKKRLTMKQPTEPVKPETVTKLEDAAAANTAAQQEASKSTAGRVKDLFNEDVSGFVQALKNMPQTWSASRKRIGAEKSLRSAMRKANKEGVPDKEGKLTKKSTAEDREAALKAALGDDGQEILDLTGYANGNATGRFKPGLPSFGPQIGRSIGDVARDIGVRSNTSLRDSSEYTFGKSLDELMKMMEGAEKGSPAEKALKRIGINSRLHPSGAMSTFKSTLLGPVTSLPMIPLAYQSEYGGSVDKNLSRIANDIRENGAGKYIAAAFPVGGQRMLAQSAIPGLTGRLGSYHPFGAIRAKETARQFQDAAEERKEPKTYEEAYNNIYGRNKK